MTASPKISSKGSKSRSRCNNGYPLARQKLAMRQSMVLRTVRPFSRMLLKFRAAVIASCSPPVSNSSNSLSNFLTRPNSSSVRTPCRTSQRIKSVSAISSWPNCLSSQSVSGFRAPRRKSTQTVVSTMTNRMFTPRSARAVAHSNRLPILFFRAGGGYRPVCEAVPAAAARLLRWRAWFAPRCSAWPPA